MAAAPDETLQTGIARGCSALTTSKHFAVGLVADHSKRPHPSPHLCIVIEYVETVQSHVDVRPHASVYGRVAGGRTEAPAWGRAWWGAAAGFVTALDETRRRRLRQASRQRLTAHHA